jgi:hypothetical protein
MKDSLRAWYVEWALASAQDLSHIERDDYFFTFPWDACLYKSANELLVFDNAVSSGSIEGEFRSPLLPRIRSFGVHDQYGTVRVGGDFG